MVPSAVKQHDQSLSKRQNKIVIFRTEMLNVYNNHIANLVDLLL